MTPRAALSPAWLGLFAISSFGGLVLASFASGYHLVVTAVPGESPTAGGTGNDNGNGSGPGNGPASASASPSATTAVPAPAAREAVVRQGLTPDLAVVRSAPDKGEILSRLPANQAVRVLSREGLWARVEFARDGKSVAGWTLASNLSMR